ncbi:hypothetical protein MMC31_004815 [Peltigera leucophlebia]|nr:hypothetical protein [Peltigera leucophlebia]
MKSMSILMAFGLFIAAQAQKECLPLAAKIPGCATGCLTSASDAVGCAATDFKCQCSPENTAAITNAALACVIGACGASTGLLVQSAAAAVCECAASAPSVTSISSPATSAASKSATSNAPTSTSNTETPVTHSSRPASSTAARSSAIPPFPTTTVANSSPSSSSPSGALRSSSVPFSPSGSSSSAPFTGGAAQTVGPAVALLGALFAAMLIL